MARIEEVILIDDLDGKRAAETIGFAVEGKAYEIDLSSENAVRFRNALAPFIEAARRVPGGARRTAMRRASSDRKRSAEIREWALRAGHKVSDRGRIPASVLAAYREAHPAA
ncbi:histone-like nucleoid-structuring protein Lsr2 [Pseudonocardia asaccharolytica]|uniref:Protein lsr2 n=1 Tax=Pseudonocardia asaccharolytica DSM 44247 = NBRC 16224 TaxID=1123024 RepID=A0A511CYM5_9PSEU|nr:Lsr2 family protein [Pseudonocardia asaccharolytica]GEL16344.1 protein lsr2 precursor [Pseudonocardia asaccharolytica DSM 44247 = NBRC 16224]